MKIRRVIINNFRGIKHKEISFEDSNKNIINFMILIGDNGCGKTAILEAITKAFVPIVRTINKNAVKERDLTNTDISYGINSTAINICVQIDSEEFNWTNSRRIYIKNQVYTGLKIDTTRGPAIKKKYHLCYSEERLPLILYYGTDRVVRKVPRRVKKRKFNVEDSLNQCFDNISYFKEFYDWFSAEQNEEKRKKKENPEYLNIRLRCVRDAIERMIPNYGYLRIVHNPSRMIMTNEQAEDLMVEQLSDGYKTILSMVSDIAKRLSMAYPKSQNPLEESAVILIDELDLHLHPRWQKTVVADLKRTFPNCQFIVTTHSPFIIQSLQKQEVLNIERDIDNYKTGSFEGWSIEEIQEYLMGIQTRTANYSLLLENFTSAVDNGNIKDVERFGTELKQMIHHSSPEKALIEMDMRMVREDD